jgi:cytochrome c556
MKNNLPQKKTIAVHALSLQMTSRVIAEAFEKEITAGRTDSKPEIWQDWEKFVEAAKTMGEESDKLARVAQSGDMEAIGAQVKAVGKSCGDCHKPFRKPKEERFKR